MKQALLSLFSFNSAKNAKLMMTTFVAMAFCIQMNAQVDCIEVEDLVLACNGNINVALNSECEAEITLAMILAGEPYNNPNFPSLSETDFELVIESNGVVVPAASPQATILSNGHLGTTLTASVSIPDCGMTCWGSIFLEDKTESVLENCDDLEITCAEFEAGTSQNNRPTFGGNCSVTMGNMTFEDDTLGTMCLNGYAVTITRHWSAFDTDGNFLTTCSQLINVLRMDVDDIVFPADWTYDYTQNDGCDVFTDAYLVPSRTGEPQGASCPNINYYYNDTDFDLCGASRKILRTWTVIDWCTGAIREDGQIIKVEDDEPVVKVCPPDTLMFPATAGKCVAQINLDPFDREHGIGQIQNNLSECSDFEMFVEWLPAVPGTDQPAEDGEYSSNGIVLEDDGTYSLPMIPEGLAWVRYRFVDACGNASPITNPGVGTDDSGSCYFEVQVIDTLPPTAICEGFTKISLDQSGFAEVLAETFDDHSFDVCGEVVDFEVKLLETNTCTGYSSDLVYGPSVHFCCNNLGDTLSIMLKVIDDTGRSSECEAKVCITGMDDAAFGITCPDDIQRNCGFDYEAYDYGDIEFSSDVDVCGIDGTPEVLSTEFNTNGLDLCGIGTVVRTVTVELPNGQTTTCSSSITLMQGNPLEYNDISIQSELSAPGCGAQFFGLEPEVIGGFPTVNNNDVCVSLTMNYVDALLVTSNASDACHKIKRTWTVIDWCTYEVNNGYTGLYTFEQIIKLNDSTNPIFSDPCENLTLDADYPDCEAIFTFDIWAEDNCTPAAELTYEWEIAEAGGGTQNGTGNLIGTNIPAGVNTVTITVYDYCGNMDVCTFTVTVTGNNPPVPICLGSVVWVLDDNGQADVWASDFDLKSEAGCGSINDLSFSFTNPDNGALTPNMSFDCSDIPNGVGASIELEVFVVDASGAYESCVVTLELQDSQGVCTDDPEARAFLGGKVFTETLVEMEEVEVELFENMTNLMNADMTAEGDYMFQDVPFYNEYMMKPYKEDDALNGVSTLDILLIQRHILDLQKLNSPYKIIAADVNRSNTVTGVDLIEIRKLVLGIYSDWQSTESWVFVPDSFNFTDVENPWPFPETVVYNNLMISDDQANFFGIKMGDVSGNAVVNFADGPQVSNRSSEAFRMEASNIDFAAGQDLTITFNAIEESAIDGLQFTVEFDASALTYAGYQRGAFALADYHVGLQNAHEGIITISYDDIKGININAGADLFALNFKTKSADKVENVVSINSAITQAEAYTSGGEIQEIILQSTESLVQGGSFELFQNQPNPFNNSTEIGFYLPEAGAATLAVMSADGKVIYTEEGNFDEGVNSIILDGTNLENKGVLLYRLEFNGYSATKKMIFIK